MNYHNFEPNLDEYLFCDRCGDYVFEYCSLHGALLVIPDTKALDLAYLRHGRCLGVFALDLIRVKSKEKATIFDVNHRRSHFVDACNPSRSNWMRYVNCARHYTEQNLLAFQYQSQLYYRTIKIIPKHTELLVFYGCEFASSLKINLKSYNAPTGFEPNDNHIQDFEEPEELFEKPREVRLPIPSRSDTPIRVLDNNTENNGEIQRKRLNCDLKIKDDPQTEQKHIVVCNECYAQFHLKTELIEHMKNHSAFVCNICGYDAFTIQTFTKHLNGQHSNLVLKQTSSPCNESEAEKHVCLFCDMSFKERKHLKIHLLKHTGEIFSCPTCENVYTNKRSLNLHILAHIEKQPACLKCDKKFSSQRCLTRHEQFIHGHVKKLSCTLCPKTFKEARSLRNHLKVHADGKTIGCPVCGKRFMKEDNFKYHLQTHK